MKKTRTGKKQIETSRKLVHRRVQEGTRLTNAARWYKYKEGNVAYGKILGRYAMQPSESPGGYYYQIKLYEKSIVTANRREDAKEIVAKSGHVINIAEAYKMQFLCEVEIPEILAGAEHDLWLRTDKKIRLSGGQTMWVIDVQTKQRKAPTSAVHPLSDPFFG